MWEVKKTFCEKIYINIWWKSGKNPGKNSEKYIIIFDKKNYPLCEEI